MCPIAWSHWQIGRCPKPTESEESTSHFSGTFLGVVVVVVPVVLGVLTGRVFDESSSDLISEVTAMTEVEAAEEVSNMV